MPASTTPSKAALSGPAPWSRSIRRWEERAVSIAVPMLSLVSATVPWNRTSFVTPASCNERSRLWVSSTGIPVAGSTQTVFVSVRYSDSVTTRRFGNPASQPASVWLPVRRLLSCSTNL